MGYYSSLTETIYGVLQGSGSAPSTWLAVSLVLIEAYKQRFNSDGFPNPTKDDYIQKLLDAFVDDTDLLDVLTNNDITLEEQIRWMIKRAQYWADLLFATGGKLNYAKCHWYLIRWKWDNHGQPKIMTKEELPEIH